MKKYLVLISVMALCACSGGGGGHGGGAPVAPIPASIVTNFNLSDVVFENTEEERISFNVDDNGQIVSMLVNDVENDNVITMNHTTGNKFALTDKWFAGLDMAGSEVYDYLNDHGYYDVEYDDIDTIWSDTELTEGQVREQIIARNIAKLQALGVEITDELRTAVQNSVQDADVEIIRVNNMTVDIASMGHDVGLQYSDFGYYTEKVDYVENGVHSVDDMGHYTYVGGLDSKNVEKPHDSEMTFNGSAAIALERYELEYDGLHWSGNITDTMISKTDDAKLELSADGTETLTMNFANASENPWYNVAVSTNDNDWGVDTFVNIDVNATATNNIANNNFKITNDLTERFGIVHDTEYYGATATPTEATAMAYINATRSEMTEEGYIQEGIQGDAVFGGRVAE